MTALRPVYIDYATRTICDLSESPLPDGTSAYMVNRVNTPQAVRGNGHASRLMRDVVLPEVDAQGATLWLEIMPTGDLDWLQLAQWYHRLGFRPEKYDDRVLWVRRPHADNAT